MLAFCSEGSLAQMLTYRVGFCVRAVPLPNSDYSTGDGLLRFRILDAELPGSKTNDVCGEQSI